jgi:hypothetical protein
MGELTLSGLGGAGVGRELSPQQWIRLEQELRKRPLAQGSPVTSAGRRGNQDSDRQAAPHRYTVRGIWKLMRRHSWSCQIPVR